MSQLKHVGPITVEVAPGHGPEGEKLGVSPTYRNLAAVDEIPTQLEGSSTLFEVFESSVSKFGDRPCLGWRPVSDDGQAGPYQFLTYNECREKARALASSLSQCGVARGGKIGVYSANSVNWMLAIRAADVLSAAIVPIYDSLGESAVEYIVKHSELTVALVETSKLVHFAKVAPSIAEQVKHVVVMDDSKLPSAASSALDTIKGAGLSVHSWEEFLRLGVGTGFEPEPPKAEDVACIMYTR